MFSLAKSRLRDDAGVALIIALNVVIIAIGLSLMVAWVAVTTNRDSGVDRQRAVAVDAAEAGLDAEFIELQTTKPGQLPCSLSNLNISVPDQPVVTRTISYTDMSGNPVSCATVQANSTRIPYKAIINATADPVNLNGVSVKRTRVMQALVTLKPVLGNGFSNAIFANGNLTMQNNHTIHGNVGNDADIYSNASVLCPSGSQQTYQGNVYSQNAITWDGNCSALGDVWGKNAVSLGGNQTTVGGRVISSTSSVSLSNLGGVSGTVMAGTTISPSSCTSPKCVKGLIQGAPPQQNFPSISKALVSQPGGWAEQGYNVVTYAGTCANFVSALQSTYAHASGGQKTLVMTSCPVNFSSTDLNLYNDLAIFADGGFSSSQQVNMNSGDGAAHNLYWIVPNENAASCTAWSSVPGAWHSGDIQTGQKFAVNSPIQMMMYTPCNADIENHATELGQIYAGMQVNIDNNFDLYFKPLPVFGVDANSLPLLSYNVDITYKREVHS